MWTKNFRPHLSTYGNDPAKAAIQKTVILLWKLWFFRCFSNRKRSLRGFLGAGNNPMVGMTVSVAVAVEESLKK